MKYFLAIDIGASSGRHILGHVEDGRIVCEEIHRFPNGPVSKNGRLVWDTDTLFKEILAGLRKCAEIGKIPYSIGIDTWAVDYVFLDRKGNRLGEAVCYRDRRTKNADSAVYGKIPEKELYYRTGIQKQPFNTIYQLAAVMRDEPQLMGEAADLLMLPDYFNYLLTGEKLTEYTNASTTGLLNPHSKDWDYELIDLLGFPRHIFGKIERPGVVIGNLRESIAKELGFNTRIVLPATHDTASAVAAVTYDIGEYRDELTDSGPDKRKTAGNILYISSGTWSLMGTELDTADCSEESRRHNFTNEGGANGRFRFLKNIMGLWMIQELRRELAPDKDFAELCKLAGEADIDSVVDANDARFLNPPSMAAAVKELCRQTGQKEPESIGEFAGVVYASLAECYAGTLKEIEELTGESFDRIHIVGGGSRADYLNRLTEKACGIKVFAGPAEATAIGNLKLQIASAKRSAKEAKNEQKRKI